VRAFGSVEVRAPPDALGARLTSRSRTVVVSRIEPTSWRMTPRRPSTVIVPRAPAMSPAMRRTMVDFPTPLAPTNAPRSPSPTWKDTSSMSTAPPGRRQVTWLSWIAPTGRTI
jgi:hypothetical protein